MRRRHAHFVIYVIKIQLLLLIYLKKNLRVLEVADQLNYCGLFKLSRHPTSMKPVGDSLWQDYLCDWPFTDLLGT